MAESEADKAASEANPNAVSVRAKVVSARGYPGQANHDLRRGPQPSYVDLERSEDNSVLIPPPSLKEMRQVCEQRRSQRDTKRAMRRDASPAVVGIITFGSEAQKRFLSLDRETQDRAYRAIAERIASLMNTTLAGLVAHRDETAQHAHFTVHGYDVNGLPLSKTLKRGLLAQCQDVAAEVIQQFEPSIERGKSRRARLDAGASPAETINRSVAELHADLPAEIEAKRAELAQAQDRVEEMERRVEETANKAQGEDDKAKKAQKRLQKYEKRLADRQADLDALNSKIQDLEDRESKVSARETKANEREEALDGRERMVSDREDRASDHEKTAQKVAEATARTVAGVISGDVSRKQGKWTVPPADVPALKPVWKAILPVIKRLSEWWNDFSHRAEELPEPPAFDEGSDDTPSM